MTRFESIHIRLHGRAEDGQPAPLDCSFEDAQRRLAELPRMFFEPDGSFVWRDTDERFQWDGEVYDTAGRVQHVEIRGSGPADSLRRLLQTLGSVAQLQVAAATDPRPIPAAEFLDAPGGSSGAAPDGGEPSPP